MDAERWLPSVIKEIGRIIFGCRDILRPRGIGDMRVLYNHLAC